MRRCIVVGTSGAGKSHFAHALARRQGAPWVELDALHWGPDWTPRPRPAFAEAVRAATAGERWVVDGNYSAVRELFWPRATDVVWLDFSRRVVWTRVLRRTLRRAATQQPLWAGNRESLRKTFASRDSILWWSVSTYARNRRKYAALRVDPAAAHLRWHTLHSPGQAARFLHALPPDASPSL